MGLTTVLAKNVSYKDGQSLGNVTVDGKSLPVRVRIYKDKGNLITFQTFYAIRDVFPDRSDWADHGKEYMKSVGLTDEEVLYVSPKTAFDAIGWTQDERHLNTSALPQNWLVGQNPDTTLTFTIKDDGTVETHVVSPDDTKTAVDKLRQTAQQSTQAEADAKAAKDKHDKLVKNVKTGGIVLGSIALVVGGYFAIKAIIKHKKEQAKKNKKKDD